MNYQQNNQANVSQIQKITYDEAYNENPNEMAVILGEVVYDFTQYPVDGDKLAAYNQNRKYPKNYPFYAICLTNPRELPGCETKTGKAVLSHAFQRKDPNGNLAGPFYLELSDSATNEYSRAIDRKIYNPETKGEVPFTSSSALAPGALVAVTVRSHKGQGRNATVYMNQVTILSDPRYIAKEINMPSLPRGGHDQKVLNAFAGQQMFTRPTAEILKEASDEIRKQEDAAAQPNAGQAQPNQQVNQQPVQQQVQQQQVQQQQVQQQQVQQQPVQQQPVQQQPVQQQPVQQQPVQQQPVQQMQQAPNQFQQPVQQMQQPMQQMQQAPVQQYETPEQAQFEQESQQFQQQLFNQYQTQGQQVNQQANQPNLNGPVAGGMGDPEYMTKLMQQQQQTRSAMAETNALGNNPNAMLTSPFGGNPNPNGGNPNFQPDITKN